MALTTQPPEAILAEIIGLLGSAISQSVPSDDQIIIGNVKTAYALAKTLRVEVEAVARKAGA